MTNHIESASPLRSAAQRPDPANVVAREDLRNRDWDILVAEGPVVATAIHDGHAVRESLQPWMMIGEEDRRREEDPLTGVWAAVGDTQVRVHTSRFEVDLNRPREKAISSDPADTWGLQVWDPQLPQEEIDSSLQIHDRFYRTIASLMDALVARWGRILLLDIHSYNHRRDGAGASAAATDANPEIDLGVTTLDRARYGALVDLFAGTLRASPVRGRAPDVRDNIRYEGGGHFPEWLYRTYGDRVCSISLEYKKIYMDEWTGQADIAVVDDLRAGLRAAVDAARPELARCA